MPLRYCVADTRETSSHSVFHPTDEHNATLQLYTHFSDLLRPYWHHWILKQVFVQSEVLMQCKTLLTLMRGSTGGKKTVRTHWSDMKCVTLMIREYIEYSLLQYIK